MQKYRISEANLSNAMKFVFEHWIRPRDSEGILDYAPKSQSNKSYLRDNPTTGMIYLKKHPQAKQAWVLVKFEHREKTFVQQNRAQQHITIRTPQEFEDFFGVAPVQNFTDDMYITAYWDKQKVTNANPTRDFDETTPNFYMYVNHLNVNVDKLVKRLYRINDIIETLGTEGGLFNIPYSPTNI